MSSKFTSLLIVIAVSGATSFGVFKTLQKTNPDSVESFEDKIKEFMDTHPEAIKQSLEKALQNEARVAQVRQNDMIQQAQKQLLEDPDSPILGNEKGSTEMVLFIDPLCGFCRKFHPIVLDAIKKNKDLKVIVKDFPIIGGQKSVEIAKFALAAKKQKKYTTFINMVYEEDTFTTEALMEMAKKSGLNIQKLKADMKGEDIMDTIRQNIKLGRDLGVEGTPAFIVNKQLHAGYRDLDTLMKILEDTGTPA